MGRQLTLQHPSRKENKEGSGAASKNSPSQHPTPSGRAHARKFPLPLSCAVKSRDHPWPSPLIRSSPPDSTTFLGLVWSHSLGRTRLNRCVFGDTGTLYIPTLTLIFLNPWLNKGTILFCFLHMKTFTNLSPRPQYQKIRSVLFFPTGQQYKSLYKIRIACTPMSSKQADTHDSKPNYSISHGLPDVNSSLSCHCLAPFLKECSFRSPVSTLHFRAGLSPSTVSLNTTELRVTAP